MNTLESLGHDTESISRYKVFYPEAFIRVENAIKESMRFSHYVGADTCVSIIKNKSVWLRKAVAMNDFKEMEHGLSCVNLAFERHGEKFKSVLNEVYPNLGYAILQAFARMSESLKYNTFIMCLSEHANKEDELGRLSMWRAYGGANSVAMVLNQRPFLAPSDAISAYTSPVEYQTPEEYAKYFMRYIENAFANIDFLRTMDYKTVVYHFYTYLRMRAMCTKHPGFEEEREWRVIYNSDHDAAKKIIKSVEVISGVPQLVYKIPLKNYPSENFIGAELPELIDRIIVGPSIYPDLIREAVVESLENSGVSNRYGLVTVSDIPLRR